MSSTARKPYTVSLMQAYHNIDELNIITTTHGKERSKKGKKLSDMVSSVRTCLESTGLRFAHGLY